MAISSRFSLMCDEVRVENNGKFLIVGMYTPDMSVPQLPFVVPILTFVFWLEGKIPGNYQFSAKLTHLESGTIVSQAMGAFGLAKAGTGLAPIRLVGVQFSQAGAYTFSLRIQDEQEILHQFSVLLFAPVMQGMPKMGD
jgi:hypothetical protein